ncbi:MAG TPA: outer membrane beta-barrel protein [Saprospiraceae bacterium]|nr:outer membrane beta-barrel protein [Saprospiraceae bacterium]HMQ84691.1 outer membrane beta-barrel protein [Saprospiraceae bacterium]
MKKLLLFSFAICHLFGLDAQVSSQGNFMMGSKLGFSTAQSTIEVDGSNTQGTRAMQLNISPTIGYFILDHWALGIGMDYAFSKVREPNDGTNGGETSFDSDLLFGPFTRAYLPVGEDKAFFLEATFGFGSAQNELEINGINQTTANNVLVVSFGPGFTIFSNDAIGIEAMAKYNWARSSANIQLDGVSNVIKTYTNAVDISIGFQFYFSRVVPSTGGIGTTNQGTNFF